MNYHRTDKQSPVEPIAIIGMGCRFPGEKDKPTDSPQAFWELLRTGKDVAREIPATRWDIDAYYDPNPDAAGKMYVRKGYFLQDVADRAGAGRHGFGLACGAAGVAFHLLAAFVEQA